MKTSALEDIGLTKAEITVYLSLLSLGTTTAGPIIRNAKLYSSIVYSALESLVTKGFVTFVKKGQKKLYQGSDPEYILRFVDRKRDALEQLLPELQAHQKPVERQAAEVFTGFRGFKVMLYEFIRDAEPGDEYRFFAFFTNNNDLYDELHDFLKEYERDRTKLGIVVRGIVPEKAREKYEGRNMKNIRFTQEDILTNIGVFRDRVIFTPWEDGESSFLIHSRQLAKMFEQYFEAEWKKLE